MARRAKRRAAKGEAVRRSIAFTRLGAIGRNRPRFGAWLMRLIQWEYEVVDRFEPLLPQLERLAAEPVEPPGAATPTKAELPGPGRFIGFSGTAECGSWTRRLRLRKSSARRRREKTAAAEQNWSGMTPAVTRPTRISGNKHYLLFLLPRWSLPLNGRSTIGSCSRQPAKRAQTVRKILFGSGSPPVPSRSWSV